MSQELLAKHGPHVVTMELDDEVFSELHRRAAQEGVSVSTLAGRAVSMIAHDPDLLELFVEKNRAK